jgi:hypothetical protein
MSAIHRYARTAKSSVHAVRRALSQRLQSGQSRVKGAVDTTGRRADDSLDAIERAAIRALDRIAQTGVGYARGAKGRLYRAEGRLFPRRRRMAPVGTALAGVGVGLLLTLLFTTNPPHKAGRRRAA